MRLFFMILIFGRFFCASALGNTTIIVLRTNDAGFIAADSKIVTVDSPQFSGSGCKIGIAKEYVFAATGIIGETKGPFNVYGIIRNAIELGGSFKAVIINLETSIAQLLPAAMEEFIPKASPILGKWIPGRSVVEVAIMKEIGGTIYLAHRRFLMVNDVMPYHVRIDAIDCPGKACPPMYVFPMGEYAAINKELDAHRAIWKGLGIQGAFNHLIELQAAETPALVSPPVSIVEIDKSGSPRWIQNGVCATTH